MPELEKSQSFVGNESWLPAPLFDRDGFSVLERFDTPGLASKMRDHPYDAYDPSHGLDLTYRYVLVVHVVLCAWFYSLYISIS
jgi:hypothetical protein